jgi:hypothetical protein
MKRAGFIRLTIPLAAALITACSSMTTSPLALPDAVVRDLARDLEEAHRTIQDARKQQAQASAELGESPSSPPVEVTVTAPTLLRAGADSTAAGLFSVMKGQTFPVVTQAPGWFAVDLGKETAFGSSTAWLPAASVLPSRRVQPRSTSTTSVYETLAAQASKIREAYRNNPHLRVSGFTVEVIPPGLSVNFEFP